MLTIKQDLLTNKINRPYLRDPQTYSIRELKGIVAHWTANTKKGANARANRSYFNGAAQYASAHYIIDDGEILQCLPDNEVGYHVGAKYYKPDGEKIMGNSGLSPNYFLIGFEMCVNEDGSWSKTYQNSVQLAAHLLRKYNFSTAQLFRHHDITGKDCPKMMLESSAWNKFKTDIVKAMSDDPKTPVKHGKVITNDLNVRSGAGTSFGVVAKLQKEAPVSIFEENNGWLRIGDKRWVSKNFVEITFVTQTGKVIDRTGANVRSGPGGNFPIVDARPFGTRLDIVGQQDRWLRIGPNLWVASSLVEVTLTRSGEVFGTDTLNVRKGPGSTFSIVRSIPKGAKVEVFEEKENWLRIGTDEWVFKGFVKI